MTITPTLEKIDSEENIKPDMSIAVFNKLIHLINANKNRYGTTEFSHNGTTIIYIKYDKTAIDKKKDPLLPPPESIEIKIKDLLTVKLTRDFYTNKPRVNLTIEPNQNLNFLLETSTKINQDLLLHLIYQLLTNNQATVAIELEKDIDEKTRIIDTTKGISIRLTAKEEKGAQELWLTYDSIGENPKQSHTRKIGEIRGDQLIFQFNLTVHPENDIRVFIKELTQILEEFYYSTAILKPLKTIPQSESKINYQEKLPPYSDYNYKDLAYQPEIQDQTIPTELFNELIKIKNIVKSDNFKIILNGLYLLVEYSQIEDKEQFKISSNQRGLEQDLILTKSKNEQTDSLEVKINSNNPNIFRILLELFNLTLEYPNTLKILRELSNSISDIESRLRITTESNGAVQFTFDNSLLTFPFAFNRFAIKIDGDKVLISLFSDKDNGQTQIIIPDQEVRNESLKNLIIQLLSQILQAIKEKPSSNTNALKAIQEKLRIGPIGPIFTNPKILTILENEANFFDSKDRYLELGLHNRFFKTRVSRLVANKYRVEIIYYTTENHNQKTFFLDVELKQNKAKITARIKQTIKVSTEKTQTTNFFDKIKQTINVSTENIHNIQEEVEINNPLLITQLLAHFLLALSGRYQLSD